MRYDDSFRRPGFQRPPDVRRGYDAFLARGGARSPALDRRGDALTDGRYGPARYGLGPYHQRLQRRRRPDDELRQLVEEALFLDSWVNADAITVQVEEGVVTLRGELPSFDEVHYAVDDAWDVVGVVGVRCQLHVDDR